MRRLLLPLLLLALPAGAQTYAVATPYCGGRLLAESFTTQVLPGPQGRADYAVTLRNPGAGPLNFVVQVTGDVIGKPTGLQSLSAGQQVRLPLGHMMNLPGRAPLRNEQLANAVRIACR